MFAADMHCDTISKLYYELKRGERTNLLSNHLQIDLIKLKKANYILQNFAVFVDTGIEKHPYQCAKGLITTFKNEINRLDDSPEILYILSIILHSPVSNFFNRKAVFL